MAHEEASMTLMEHLEELRDRLIKSLAALLVGMLISTLFAKRVLAFLIALAGDNLPQAYSPTAPMVMFFKVALVCGAALAMPVIVYQLLRFIVPGLTRQERRYLFFALPGIILCFVGGVAFAYFVLLPPALRFLQGFLSDIIEPKWVIEKYISLVTSLLFWTGVTFQTPLVMAFLARLGIVTPQMLIRFWRYALVIIAVIAAAITPTVDPLNMSLVMAPLVALYGIGILLARLAYRERTAPAKVETAPSPSTDPVPPTSP